MIHSVIKPGFGEPGKETQKNMSLQAQAMVSMAETHQNLYGRVRHIFVSFEHLDSFLFPLDEEVVIAVGCLRPYTFEEIVAASERVLKAHQVI